MEYLIITVGVIMFTISFFLIRKMNKENRRHKNLIFWYEKNYSNFLYHSEENRPFSYNEDIKSKIVKEIEEALEIRLKEYIDNELNPVYEDKIVPLTKQDLERELDKCIDNEDYDTAAWYRDKLNTMESDEENNK